MKVRIVYRGIDSNVRLKQQNQMDVSLMMVEVSGLWKLAHDGTIKA